VDPGFTLLGTNGAVDATVEARHRYGKDHLTETDARANIGRPSAGSSDRPSYLAALDPWLPTSQAEAERTLKEGCLTARRLVVSDNQLVNNPALHRLLRRRDVQEFLLTPDPDGRLPVMVGLREGAASFEDVLEELVTDRERPAILPWLSAAKQRRLEAAYRSRHGNSLGPLFDIAGPEFVDHVALLNRFLERPAAAVVRWKGLQRRYYEHVRTGLDALAGAVARESPAVGTQGDAILRACADLREGIESGAARNRSNLFRVLSASTLTNSVQRALTLRLLHRPYHLNFAAVGSFNMITGTEYALAPMGDVLPTLARKVKDLEPEQALDLEPLPMALSEVPYRRVRSIRHSRTFSTLINELSHAPEHQRVAIISELFDFFRGQFAHEPRGLRKLQRFRVSAFRAPDELRAELSEAGLSFSDMLSLVAASGGFAAGEAIGWSVGIVGIGGAAGATVGTVVERAIERVTNESRRRKEFRQLVQLLAEQGSSARAT
jgi:hypothetical protein